MDHDILRPFFPHAAPPFRLLHTTIVYITFQLRLRTRAAVPLPPTPKPLLERIRLSVRRALPIVMDHRVGAAVHFEYRQRRIPLVADSKQWLIALERVVFIERPAHNRSRCDLLGDLWVAR